MARVPISSAAVERVCSQVKFIIETTGMSALKELLETRVMEHDNHYWYSIEGQEQLLFA